MTRFGNSPQSHIVAVLEHATVDMVDMTDMAYLLLTLSYSEMKAIQRTQDPPRRHLHRRCH